MRRLLAAVVVVVSLGALSATAADAAATTRLSARETKWAKPMLTVWTTMNAGLHIVIAQAAAQDALIAGTTNNGKLTRTLTVFVDCGLVVAKAGKPPTARLQPFDTSLKTMCAHLASGAHDLARAVGYIGKHQSKLATARIKAMDVEFSRATDFLKQAETQITAVGGGNVFKA